MLEVPATVTEQYEIQLQDGALPRNQEEPTKLPSPAEAMRSYDEAEKAAAKANKAAKEAKEAKAKAKAVALASLEEAELESASVRVGDRRILFYTGEFRAFNVSDKQAFREWAKEQDESYFEPEARIREDLVRQECERRLQDGEELPPGVTTYTETRIYRQAQ